MFKLAWLIFKLIEEFIFCMIIIEGELLSIFLFKCLIFCLNYRELLKWSDRIARRSTLMYMAWRSTVVHPVFSLLASVLLKMKGNALKLKKKECDCAYISCSIFALVNTSDYYDTCSTVKYHEIKIEI